MAALRLLVCEYVTGGGRAGQPMPPGLGREGDLMLRALVKDLHDVPGVEVTVARDRRLPAPMGADSVHWIDAGDDPWAAWAVFARSVDAVWPVAPETGGVLARLTELALAAGARLVGSPPDAVRLAASKRASAERLAAFGVAVPGRPPADPVPGWVAKPDDGAGAEDTVFFAGRQDLERWLADGRASFVVQPYVPGEPASLSLLCRAGEAWLLSCNRQHVAVEDGRFHYRGGIVGALEARRPRYEPVAAAVARAMPGLWGYVGVDLVDPPDEGGVPVVLDVNPRLTTSYIGLRAATGSNPAALALALFDRTIGELRRPLRVAPVPIDLGEDADG